MGHMDSVEAYQEFVRRDVAARLQHEAQRQEAALRRDHADEPLFIETVLATKIWPLSGAVAYNPAFSTVRASARPEPIASLVVTKDER